MSDKIKPMAEADLNVEAIKMGQVYIKTRYAGADLATKTVALNGAACGFFSGIRFYERHILGLNPPGATPFPESFEVKT